MAGALHRCGGAPFEHQLAADEGAVERTRNGVGHHAGGMGNEDDAQRDLSIGRADFVQHGVEMGAGDDVVAARHQARKQRKGRRHEEREDQHHLPDERRGRLHHVPAEHGGAEPGDRDQRPAQVVVHLPAAEHGQPLPALKI